MKSPRELMLADMVARIEKARAERSSRLPELEREYKFARIIPGLPVSWQQPDGGQVAATVVNSTDQGHILIEVRGRRKWVPLDSLSIVEDASPRDA
jgi:hypothetical protein